MEDRHEQEDPVRGIRCHRAPRCPAAAGERTIGQLFAPWLSRLVFRHQRDCETASFGGAIGAIAVQNIDGKERIVAMNTSTGAWKLTRYRFTPDTTNPDKTLSPSTQRSAFPAASRSQPAAMSSRRAWAW